MTIEKPKIQRAYITIRDPDSGESTHVVVYNATVKEIAASIKGAASNPEPPNRGRRIPATPMASKAA